MNAPLRDPLTPPGADFDGPVFSAGNQATARDMVASVILLAAVSAVYLSAVVSAAQQSIAFEAALGIGLPLFVLLTGQVRFRHPRLLELMLIESVFNVLAVTSRLAHAHDLPGLDEACGWLLAAWFTVQIAGFLRGQWRRGCWSGVYLSALAAVVIGWWFLTAPQVGSVVDAQGRLLLWGSQEPLVVRLWYVVWALNLSINGTKTLPLVRQHVVQWVSIGVALASGAFFHTRLMTACHLFVLDLVLMYSCWPVVLGERTAVLPAAWHDRLRAWSDRIAVSCCIAGTGLVIAAMRWGLSLVG